jgi:hypothetical protein
MRDLLLPLLTLFFLSVASPSSSGWANDKGNGGGIAEKNLLFAYANLSSFIELCQETPSVCKIDSAVAFILLNDIKLSLTEGHETAELIFDSELQNPGMFMIDGKVRVAKTGDQQGSPIYINSDLIYAQDAQGQYTAMDIPMAASVLIHELGHHFKIQDHGLLDRVGTIIQLFLMHKTQKIGWNPMDPMRADAYQATTIGLGGQPNTFDPLLISDSHGLTNLTDLLKSKISCDEYPNAVLSGFVIKNLHWGWGGSADQSTMTFQTPLRFWLASICKGLGSPADEFVVREASEITLTLVFKYDENASFTLLPEQTQFKSIVCTENPEKCH